MTIPVEVDGTFVHAYFAEAIGAYEDASASIARQASPVSPAAFGASFAGQGERIAAGLDALQRRGVGLLRERAEAWQRVRELVDAVSTTDSTFADQLKGAGHL